MRIRIRYTDMYRYLVSELSAAEVLEHIDGDNLVRLLKIYGKVKRPRSLVTDLVEARYLARSLKGSTVIWGNTGRVINFKVILKIV